MKQQTKGVEMKRQTITINSVELQVERVISKDTYILVGGIIVTKGKDGEYHRDRDREANNLTKE
jgi:hypothetical protein